MVFSNKITKNKAVEMQLTTFNHNPWINFELSFHFRRKGDHPGFFFYVSIAKLWFEFNVYDIHHEEEIEKA